ncbi:MAG TPA: tRNA lysidine(34) synthetase TilS [Methanosarcina sp.]|nr:tRNA lysidine(34) synthetase TilS [Methanosarcina sp.]
MSNLKFIGDLPNRNYFVAVSGGSDSIALLHMAAKLTKEKPIIFHYNHGDENADIEEQFVRNHAAKYGFEIIVDRYEGDPKPTCKSPKEFFREHRYAAIDRLNSPILIGHTLDDVVENYLFTFLRGGEGYFIPYSRKLCVRPLLTNTKQDCVDFLSKNGIQWLEDPTNSDCRYTRNYIRHKLLPSVKEVNPGFRKVVKRKLIEKLTKDGVL